MNRFTGFEADQPFVGYLLKTYPKLSETFILNEILQLEKLGTRLHLFSLKKPPFDEKFHPGVHQVQANVTYVPSIGMRSNPLDSVMIVLDHVQLFVLKPRRYFRTLNFHLRSKDKPRLKEFIQAGFLARALERRGISHLHAHFANVPTYVAELVSRFCPITYSFTAHAKDIYLTHKPELARKMEHAEFVLTCTGYNKTYLDEIGSGRAPVHLAYHGVDLSRFQRVDKRVTGNDVPHIISVGRFCEKKGFPYLIDACAELKARGFAFHCSIVGWGELRDSMLKRIADLDLQDQVQLMREMAQDELVEFYQTSDIFVLACILGDNGDRDGIPNVLIEAMAMQLPCVSTKVSGIPELIENLETGVLVPEKSSSAIADALALLSSQPDLRGRLGAKARKKVLEQFELKRNVERVQHFLFSVTKAEAAPGHATVETVPDLSTP